MPQITLIRVVLPAPFGPSSAKISPRSISRLTPLRALNPDAYSFESLETVMMGDTRPEDTRVSAERTCTRVERQTPGRLGRCRWSVASVASHASHASVASAASHAQARAAGVQNLRER